MAWWLLREPANVHTVLAVTVGLVAFFLFGFRGAAVHDPDWYVFLAAGALAICAFILPGVSGSFLLLAIGMYQHVLGAVNDLDPASLLPFALGAAAGLGMFSRLLEWLLDRYHDLVVAAMIGLMIGSFRILWPWPSGLGDGERVRCHDTREAGSPMSSSRSCWLSPPRPSWSASPPGPSDQRSETGRRPGSRSPTDQTENLTSMTSPSCTR